MNDPLKVIRSWHRGQVPVLKALGGATPFGQDGYIHAGSTLGIASVVAMDGGHCWTVTHMATGRWVGAFGELLDAAIAGAALSRFPGWAELLTAFWGAEATGFSHGEEAPPPILLGQLYAKLL